MLELQGGRRLCWKAMFPSWLQYQCHVVERGLECQWFYCELISHSINTTRLVEKGNVEDCLKVAPIGVRDGGQGGQLPPPNSGSLAT